MVSAAVCMPVVNVVADTVAVQPAPKPRLSVTWTVPRLVSRWPPGAVVPRLATVGAVMDSSPAMMLVTPVQAGLVVPGGQVLPGLVEAAVLVRTRPPRWGLPPGT